MNSPVTNLDRRRQKVLGDFPTPTGLVQAILDHLGPIGERYRRVLEPTCGEGAFLAGLLGRGDCPAEIRGIEIQADYCRVAQRRISEATPPTRVTVDCADVFQVDLASLGWQESGPLLVVGNLPWVTNAALGASDAIVPTTKTNERRARGIDALTGASNFDISEALWNKIIRELAPQSPTVALIGKTAVAREVFRSIEKAGLPVVAASLRRIDAHRWFGVSVEAGLLVVEFGGDTPIRELPIYADLMATEPRTILGMAGDRMIADSAAYGRVSHLDGVCPYEWRQGIKHDAADVMELVEEAGAIRNKRGEAVDVEREWIFPLRKGSDLASSDRSRPVRHVIVTQRRLNEPIDSLIDRAPRLWRYLEDHGSDFDRRRSSIYRGRHRYALFGVGDYSFAPYKVAVSGLHKDSRFQVVGPVEGRPVLFDDTCYFLPFETEVEADEVLGLLNRPEAKELIRCLSFRDAKRPITKALLRRIDLAAVRGFSDHRPTCGSGLSSTEPSSGGSALPSVLL